MTLYAPHSSGKSAGLIVRRACSARNFVLTSAATLGIAVLFSSHPEQVFAAFTEAEIAPAEPERFAPDPAPVRIADAIPAISPREEAPAHITEAALREEMRQVVAKPRLEEPDQFEKYAMLSAPDFDTGTLEEIARMRMPEPAPVAIVPPSLQRTRTPDAAPDIDRPLDFAPIEPVQVERFHGIGGEDLAALLDRMDVRADDVHATVVALRADDIPEKLSEGDIVDLATENLDPVGTERRLLGLRLALAAGRELELRWDGGIHDLWADLKPLPGIETDVQTVAYSPVSVSEALGEDALRYGESDSVFVRGEVDSTLYEAAADAGMTPGEAETLAAIFRYMIDFERDLRKGDTFEVLFEKKENGDYGDIVYAAIDNRGKRRILYRGRDNDGVWGYFDSEGRTNKRALMRTPVAYARISSKFGMRKHPIQGYRKMHRGVDFAAPTGTPILAAGDGVVEYVGHRGTYGKYIRIRHRNGFKTAYAHLSRYASNLRSGVRISQGEVIGHVGSTGRSTGPHLHFEVLKDGERINPMEVGDFGQIEGLSGTALARFQANVARVELVLAELRPKTRVAQVVE